MTKTNTLYEQVVKTSTPYLGPATERFIDRQIQNHLHIEPHKLTQKDLAKLIDWIQIAVSFLSEDGKLIDDYIAQLRELSLTSRDSKRDDK